MTGKPISQEVPPSMEVMDAASLLESLPADSPIFGESGINNEGDAVPAREKPEKEDEERDNEEDTDEDDADQQDEDDDSDDADEDADEDEDDEEDYDREEEEIEVFTVKVNGEDQEVTLDELKQGYSRQADYTRKTQQLAEERAALVKAADEIAHEREEYGIRLEKLGELLAASIPQEPDWAKLRAERPDQYATEYADWQRKNAQLRAVAEERTRVAQQQAEHVQAKLAEHMQEEQKKLNAAIPEWAEQAKREQEQVAMVQYAKDNYGWTDEDIGSVTDHRLMLILRKAMLYDNLEQKKKQVKVKKSKKVKRLKPGQPQQKSSSKKRRVREKSKKLAQSGKVDDAASMLFDMIED